MRKPKNIKEYIDPTLAGMRLMQLTLDRVMGLKPGWKVKWELKINYYNENPPEEMKIIPSMGQFGSGEEEPEDERKVVV